MCARLPERLHEAAKQCFDNWNKYCMWKNEEMEALVRELKAKGYGLYVCSNASHPSSIAVIGSHSSSGML
ncbi:MAG: hypothetical protein ACLTF6_07495 [Clostridium sp.]